MKGPSSRPANSDRCGTPAGIDDNVSVALSTTTVTSSSSSATASARTPGCIDPSFLRRRVKRKVTRSISACSRVPRGGPGSRSDRTIVEVERTVARAGTVSLGQKVVLAAEILAGRRVGIYIEEGALLLFFDPQTRELLRTGPNPLAPGEAARLQRGRPVGSVPRPSSEPVTVQRRASNTGIVTVAGQQVALGRDYVHQTVTIRVSETTLAIELPDADTRVVRRTTTQPVRSIKGQRPRTANTSVS